MITLHLSHQLYEHLQGCIVIQKAEDGNKFPPIFTMSLLKLFAVFGIVSLGP
jgi:hypothetical protein